MLKQLLLGVGGMAVLGLGVSNASALTVNGSGQVTDWNLTPFANTAPADVTAVYQNNYSPINYPHGVGHQPSPGGSTGEKFDLEGLYSRRNGNQVQVLLVASSLFQATAGGQTFNLGDLMIDVGNDGSFDMGVVTQTGNAGLVAGGLYDITTSRGLQEKPGSYYQYASVTSQIGAWAVQTGDLLGQHDILTDSHWYAGTGAGTSWMYEFTFDLTDDLLYSDLYMQLAWGCGNDVIGLTLAGLEEPEVEIDITPDPTPSPEPATAMLGVMGLTGLLVASRRRR